ncbi:MAG: hypothetical protein K2X27_17030 [Candidatus Obscuribacterales bacterium]|nr:hypothetical protein [Candidatus Obscuribacterales bacterium]
MTNTAKVDSSKTQGPSGFIQTGSDMLVVDYGKVIDLNGTQIGFLYEDGLIEGRALPLGEWEGLKTIEELGGAYFQGIDSNGLQLNLPGIETGPIGGLKYNNRDFLVLFGRVATPEHKLVGRMSDDGVLQFRDPRFPGQMRKMDEHSQLSTFFQGTKSNGQVFKHEFARSLHRLEKSYWENEVIRYFEDIDRVNGPQKKYVFDTMWLFAVSGLLQMVRRSEGTAGLGNVKHGASGVTGVRTGNVTLDREEFEREVNFFKKYGPLMAVPARAKPFIEVRLNMVVSHEYGHQLEFCLSKAAQDRIQEIYEKRLHSCERLHPVPEEAETYSELIQPQQVDERIFVSGYARTSWHEYFAECVAAFALKESRDMLKQIDPEIHELLLDVLLKPEKVVSTLLQEGMLNLQASLRVGGELPDDILSK